jgi:FtsH-binding integral membrane protein
MVNMGWVLHPVRLSAIVSARQIDAPTTMRTALFLLSGLLLMAAFLILGKLFSPQFPESSRVATFSFVAVWFAVAALNMWLGVARAGYSVADELPIFLLIFGMPSALAWYTKWQFL